MKFLIILVFSLLSFVNLNAQDLVFELSVKWEKTKQPLRFFKSENKTPYLMVTMRNLGGDKIYFKNPFKSKSYIPYACNLLYPRGFIKSDNDINKLYKIEKKEYYYLVIGSDSDFETYEDCIDILDKELKHSYDNNIADEYGYVSVGRNSNMLYNLFKLQNYFNTRDIKKQSKLFNYSNTYTMNWEEVRERIVEMEVNNIDTIYFRKSWFEKPNFFISGNRFIFLKPNESKTIKFNLLGFKILGGSYEFQIGSKSIKGYVIGEPKDGKENKLFLPKKIKEHKLYKGKLISNKIILNFDD